MCLYEIRSRNADTIGKQDEIGGRGTDGADQAAQDAGRETELENTR